MFKKLILRIIVAGTILCGATASSFAADASTPVQTLGWYINSAEGPDSMTATDSVPIEAVGGEFASDNSEDIVLVSDINGTTVTFAGRSANSGCFYTTWGRYLSGGGSGGDGGDNYWLAFFDKETLPEAYLTAYVTRPSPSENGLVFVGEESSVVVELHSAAPGRTYSVSLHWQSSDGAVVTLSETEVPISEASPVVMPIFGVEPGTGVIIKDGVVVARLGDPPAPMPAPPPTPPVPVRARDNGGSVSIPMTANITKDYIKGKLNDTVGDGVKADVDKLKTEINTAFDAIKKAAPKKVLGINIQEKMDPLITEAKKQISDNADKLKKQVDDGIDQAAGTLKDKIDASVPKVRVSGTYLNGQWGNLKASINGLTEVNAYASFGASTDLELSAIVAGIKVPVSITIKVTGSVSFDADTPCVADSTQTTTDASAVPIVKPKISMSVAGQAGLTWDVGAGVAESIPLQPVSGTLVKGEYN